MLSANQESSEHHLEEVFVITGKGLNQEPTLFRANEMLSSYYQSNSFSSDDFIAAFHTKLLFGMLLLRLT